MKTPWNEGPDWPSRALDWLVLAAGVLLFGMMLLTFVDVVGRYFFNSPVSGSSEATEILLAVIIFAGIPAAAARGEHITIDLLGHLLGQRTRRILAVLGGGFAALVMGVVAWRLWLRAAELLSYDERSSHLNFPLGWLAAFLTFCAALAVFGFILFVRRQMRDRA
ncbi:MAG: TRAP transporter small permease [Sulfuritalea sp.]|nr:TRAP transporter small permease [Sulfuritalea sp.]